MAQAVKAGTILISERTLLPESVQVASEPYSKSWRTVTDLDGDGLDRQIRKAGWHFFFLAGKAKASVFGSNAEKAIKTAVEGLSRDWEKFNSLEIARVEIKRFLGFPYVSVFAHWRHIQESMFLIQPERRI